jgi:ABC-type nitrate/sulfonate/bicarbonate transport system substrate-binding protein
MKTKIGLILGLVLALVVGGSLAFIACRKGDQPGFQKTALRLRWSTQSQFAGIYWAQDKGIFRREGLDVTINPGGPTINHMQIVGSGSEEFGIAGAAQIVEARDKGIPVVALAIIYQGNPNVFFSKKESGIKGPKDWVGKEVAVFHGYDLEYMYRAMLKKNGIDPSSVKEYPAKFDMTPFLHGDVDVWAGYIINQPNTAEEQGIEINRIYPNDYGINVSGDTLFTTEDVIKNHPERCQKMVNAILEGWREALQNKEAAVNLVLSLDNKLQRVHETKMINSVEGLTLTKDINGKIGWMTLDQWSNMAALWKEFGGLKNEVDPNRCFDMRFVKTFYESPTKR